jgi:hypothetical protein
LPSPLWRTVGFLTGGGVFVTQFDWEYYLPSAFSLALVVVGLLFILFLAM